MKHLSMIALVSVLAISNMQVTGSDTLEVIPSYQPETLSVEIKADDYVSHMQENFTSSHAEFIPEDKPQEVKVKKIEEEKPKPKLKSMEVPEVNSSFKSYMDYKCITNKSSSQWQLQKKAVTSSTGIRMYGDCYLVALGTYYTTNIGDIFYITFEDGGRIKCMIGDLKAVKDTDSKNQHMSGNIVEFIVDTPSLPKVVRKMGDISYIDDKFTGKVIKIEKEVK